MENKNNPVSRLRENLLIFKTGARNDAQISELWAKVFDCKVTDTITIFNGIGLMHRLNAEAREATETFSPGSPDFFFKPFGQIEHLLSKMALHTQWANISSLLNQETMTALEFIEHFIDANYSKPRPDSGQKIVDLLNQVDALIESCVVSNLDEELKKLFVKQLQALRSALLSFRISGPTGLEDAMSQVTGALMRNQSVIKDRLDKNDPFSTKFFDILSKANDLTAGYQTAVIALAPIGTMLLDVVR
ncbi:hypothetical protein [Pseudomonas sp. TSRC2-2]|uniref:hypothetical protein n=1 Tax=unclassified Pseudomonas TaxID=196821 RepID=UPI003CF9B5AA